MSTNGAMRAEHTPGPWGIEDMPLPSRKLVRIGNICEVPQPDRRAKHYSITQLDKETQANISLIAAAPEL